MSKITKFIFVFFLLVPVVFGAFGNFEFFKFGKIFANENPTIELSNRSKIPLAKIYNEDSMDFDRNFRLKYLNEYDFNDLKMHNITKPGDFFLAVGNKNDNIKGFKINNSNFVVDLISCDSYNRFCVFRVNGVPTQKLYSQKDFGNNRKHTFDLDSEYQVKINTIEFDFCDNKMMCHLGYEAYHMVNISIERNG